MSVNDILKGYAEKLEGAEPGVSVEQASKEMVDQIERRRRFKDEMEKLIGVREFDQHPKGIVGGAVALLDAVSQNDAYEDIGWRLFVIGELMAYINMLGNTENFMRLAEEHKQGTIDKMVSFAESIRTPQGAAAETLFPTVGIGQLGS
jgi:hypothetical protein